MEEEEEAMERRRRLRLPLRRPRWATVLIGFILLILLLFAIIWSQRRQLATDYIERELERRGVEASYRVTRIGFRTQRLSDVVIGNPARPDLIARNVEVRLLWRLWGPRIDFVNARGVRIFGRLVDRKLSFGELDKLLPPPTDAPFRLPDLDVDVADTAIALDLPAGRLAAAIEGRGNLADGFRGELAAVSSELLLGGCAVEAPRAHARVAINDRRPSIDGPIRAERFLCPDAEVDLASPVLNVDANFAETINAWRGNAGLQVQRAQLGTNSAAGINGTITFDGRRRLTRGTMDLTAVQARFGDFTTSRTNIDGGYAISLGTGNLSVVADARAQGVSAADAVRPLADLLSSAGGTPLEPIGDGVAGALSRAASAFEAMGSLRLVNAPGYGAVRFGQLSLESRSGARFGLSGGDGLTYYWPSGDVRLDGEFALSGGGLPATRVSLVQPRGGAPLRGEARIAPMTVRNARLALAPIRFRAESGGTTRIETQALLSGPFNDGYVQGLSMPIVGRFGNGGFSINQDCSTATFRSLRAAGLTLGPTRLPLCPTGRALVWSDGGEVQGGAEIREPRLAGNLGGTPITMVADRVRFALADPGFTSANVAIRLGQPGSVNRLDLETLAGDFTDDGVDGAFTGAAGKIANVPLLLLQGQGGWRVLGGDVTVDGEVTVADEMDPPRFWPLRSDDFHLTLVDGVIDATGWLQDPETGTRITEATIRHVLDTGVGNAALDVPGITFALDGYQPEELTRLTTGVVALVDGTLTGRGQINWNPEGTTSTGTFSTTDMNLAAPFGPVEGLTTTVNFTDLLGLMSAPGQVANVDLIRTGIDVVDGTILYQLLPDQRVRVESGIWPFMGGQLTLDETVLDFSQPSTKRLTFRVIGLDAATFVEQMEFANINATGTFDGIIPMEFDDRGGRIVGGRLEARPPGGELSYIGEVSEAALGTFGKMAFDALKSFRYERFTIGLDGYLAGEFLAEIELDGLNRNTGETGGLLASVLSQLDNIPFEFNISIRGPFRALIATARSFEDPTDLIQPVLPEVLQGLPTDTRVIREEESQTQTQTPPPPTIPETIIQPEESEGVQ